MLDMHTTTGLYVLLCSDKCLCWILVEFLLLLKPNSQRLPGMPRGTLGASQRGEGNGFNRFVLIVHVLLQIPLSDCQQGYIFKFSL